MPEINLAQGYNRILFILLAAALLCLAGPATAAAAPEPPAQGQELLDRARAAGTLPVIVELAVPDYRPEANLPAGGARADQRAEIATRQQELLDRLPPQAQAGRRYQTLPYLALTADAATLESLLASPLVAGVIEDQPSPPTLDSSMPVIGAPTVWGWGYQGSGQTVVILDTGIDAYHPFFAAPGGGSRVVYQACFSDGANSSYDTATLCPDGSRTQYGGDAASARLTAPAANPTCNYNGTNLCNHGTHVAGIAAGSNGSNLHGVAPAAEIIALQVFTRFNNYEYCSGPCALTWNSDQIAALDYVNSTLRHSYNIPAVNMSLGGGKYTDEASCDSNAAGRKAAIDALRAANIATIIATGNYGYTDGIGVPGCISTAVAVGSTTDSDTISSFSNMDEMVELLAPGSSIISSVPDGGYASFNGTSMAAPTVAGAWALLAEMYPASSVDQRLALLAGTGVPVADTRSGGTVTKPRIQVDATDTTLLVDTTVDSNAATYQACDDVLPADCSLRGALSRANGVAGVAYTVDLPAGNYALTIAGSGEEANTSGDLDIGGALTVRGAGARETVVDGNGLDRVFHIQGDHLVSLGDLTVRSGAVAGAGGGILNDGGTLTLTAVQIEGNATTGAEGGGLANRDGTVTITGSTISGNSAAGSGGGVTNTADTAGASIDLANSTIAGNSSGAAGGGLANLSQGREAILTLNNVTVTDNSAASDGGGLYSAASGGSSADITLANSIATANGGTADCATSGSKATIASGGYNLVGGSCPAGSSGDQTTAGDGGLRPLADNGGATDTIALTPGSPARGNGDPATCEAADQRGVDRSSGGTCDSGAYELWQLQVAQGNLSWIGAGSGCTYGVFESAQPYFTPAGSPTYEDVASPFTAPGNGGASRYFIGGASCNDGEAFSNPVGEFHFSLKPGG